MSLPAPPSPTWNIVLATVLSLSPALLQDFSAAQQQGLNALYKDAEKEAARILQTGDISTLAPLYGWLQDMGLVTESALLRQVIDPATPLMAPATQITLTPTPSADS